MQLEKLYVYRTTDGQLFEDREEAEKAQRKVSIHHALTTILADDLWHVADDVGEIIDVVFNNIEEIVMAYDMVKNNKPQKIKE